MARKAVWVSLLAFTLLLRVSAYAAESLTHDDVDLLRQTHDNGQKKYTACVKAAVSQDCAADYISQLRSTGIEELIDAQPEGVSPSERAAWLNDYAFLLSKQGPDLTRGTRGNGTYILKNGIYILRKVVALAPKRAIAWLNLGDALAAEIDQAETPTEKLYLVGEAADAYSRYRELSGKDAPVPSAVRDLIAHPGSDNVCSLVLSAFLEGSLSEISSQTGFMKAPRGPEPFHIVTNGGGLPDSVMFDKDDIASEDALNRPEFQQPPELNQDDDNDAGNDIDVVHFKGTDYIAYSYRGVLLSVIGPGKKRQSCRIERSENKEELVANENSDLCSEFLANPKAFDPGLTEHPPDMPAARLKLPVQSVDWAKVAESANKEQAGDDLWLVAQARVTISGRIATLGWYHIDNESSHPSQQRGLYFLEGSKEEDSPRNQALTGAQGLLDDGENGRAAVFTIGGDTYFFFAGKKRVGNMETPVRSLQKFIGDTLDNVCEISKVQKYKVTAN